MNLDDFLSCHNLGSTKVATSPSIAHRDTYRKDHPIYSIDPDKILNDINALKDTFLSPRLTYVLLSCWYRNGYRIGIGLDDTRWFCEGNIERINKLAELEVAFEKVRRQVDALLPSRLLCIYLAEDNFEGRTMLQNMFPSKRNFKIVPVNIRFKERIHKADSKWISEYEKTGSQLAIENYWTGLQVDHQPQFEYLIDGQIELTSDDDAEYIRQYGVKT